MSQIRQGQDQPGRSSRREMLQRDHGCGHARLDRTGEQGHGPGQSIQRPCRQERPDQTIDRLLVLRKVLGHGAGRQDRQAARLRQHRADGPQVLPRAQAAWAILCDRDDRHEPGPAVRQGIQQPQVPRASDQGDPRRHRRLREFGYKNVICFTGMREGIPDDVGPTTASRDSSRSSATPRRKGSPSAWRCSTPGSTRTP